MRNIFALSLLLASLTSTSPASADITRHFDCVAPRFGSDRCGDAQKNYRVPGRARIKIEYTSAGANVCMLFTIKSAVGDNTLHEMKDKICPNNTTGYLWSNPSDEPVDVYFNVKSVGDTRKIQIHGNYIFEE